MKNNLFSTLSLLVLLHFLATVSFAAAPTADELLKKQGFVWKTAVTDPYAYTTNLELSPKQRLKVSNASRRMLFRGTCKYSVLVNIH